MPRPDPTRYGFRIGGLAPINDPAWSLLGTSQRTSFWRAVADVALELFDEQCARGLDRFGRRLARLAQSTIDHRRSAMGPADPKAPPLTPAYGLSRTRSFVRHKPDADGVTVYWLHDPRVKTTWGQILSYHADGAVPGGKVRDVLGLAPRYLELLRAWTRDYWRLNRVRLVRRAHPEPLRDQAEAQAEAYRRGPERVRVPRIRQVRPVEPRLGKSLWSDASAERVNPHHIDLSTGKPGRPLPAQPGNYDTGWRTFNAPRRRGGR